MTRLIDHPLARQILVYGNYTIAILRHFGLFRDMSSV
jgi:hypothetical protein